VHEVKFVVFPTVILSKKDLYATPRAVYGVCVDPGVRIELDAVQNIVEGEITLVEPRPLLDGHRLITPDPSKPPTSKRIAIDC
jgi:hypothetical protein